MNKPTFLFLLQGYENQEEKYIEIKWDHLKMLLAKNGQCVIVKISACQGDINLESSEEEEGMSPEELLLSVGKAILRQVVLGHLRKPAKPGKWRKQHFCMASSVATPSRFPLTSLMMGCNLQAKQTLVFTKLPWTVWRFKWDVTHKSPAFE